MKSAESLSTRLFFIKASQMFRHISHSQTLKSFTAHVNNLKYQVYFTHLIYVKITSFINKVIVLSIKNIC